MTVAGLVLSGERDKALLPEMVTASPPAPLRYQIEFSRCNSYSTIGVFSYRLPRRSRSITKTLQTIGNTKLLLFEPDLSIGWLTDVPVSVLQALPSGPALKQQSNCFSR